jgi:hypothetical protein
MGHTGVLYFTIIRQAAHTALCPWIILCKRGAGQYRGRQSSALGKV